MVDPSEDPVILQRKLADTEARVIARLLRSASQVVPEPYLTTLTNKMKENEAYDKLQIDRDIASDARLISDNLVSLVDAVRRFKAAKQDFEEYQQGGWPSDDTVDPQKLYDSMIVQREKMFSLLDEYDVKKRMVKQNPI